ncbi:sulfotransferase [Phaeovibrio sulfidiphilus]|uniref:Sulfotransferase n=1 Tax=Phaeovibrio sulfidiphilus TaxID=1220600 RepID=A0A8J6YWD1_9PROT|nr:sulfotransferase [Phaeovibrio sulfidiphilus]
MAQARAAQASGAGARAWQAWQAVLAEDPQSLEARVCLAELALARREVPLARDLALQVRGAEPDNPRAALVLAQCALAANRPREALAEVDGILARRSGDARALAFRASLRLGAGDLSGAVQDLRAALRSRKDDPSLHLQLGIALARSGLYDEALPHFKRACQLAPEDPGVHLNQAQAFLDAGQPQRSLAASARAVALAPGLAGAHVLQALAFDRLENFGDARLAWERALNASPDVPSILNDAGTFLHYDNDPQAALPLVRRALELAPDHLAFRENLVAQLMADNRLDEAEQETRDWLRQAPDSVAAVRTLGDLLVRRGEFRDARTRLSEALERHPHDDTLAVAYSATSRFSEADATADAILERARQAFPELDGTPAEPAATADLAYAAGKILDDRGEFERAFSAYRIANTLRGQDNPFDFKAFESRSERVREVFTPKLFERLRDIGSDSETPVFVVGLPRSGTTLVEQIIASHPDAAGAGELSHFTRFENSLTWRVSGGRDPYPDCVGALNAGTVEAFARSVLATMDRVSGGAKRVVDKLPHNALRLGLVHAVFPKARIVCLRRSLPDTCLSIYFQNFTHGHGYRHDLEVLGRYAVRFRAMMDHWREALPVPVFDLDYAALVADPEPNVRALLDYLGLEWDPQVLSFHTRRDGQVATASRWQVRQPINTRSVERWRRYGSALDPLLNVLEKEGIPL